MYVCICNAVTEDDVHGCMTKGACATVKDVKAACGMQAGCGSCTRRISALISEYRTASELADALTGGPLPLSAVPGAADAPPVVPGPATDPMPVTAEPGPAAPETVVSGPLAEHLLAEHLETSESMLSESMMSEQAGRGTAPPTAA